MLKKRAESNQIYLLPKIAINYYGAVFGGCGDDCYEKLCVSTQVSLPLLPQIASFCVLSICCNKSFCVKIIR